MVRGCFAREAGRDVGCKVGVVTEGRSQLVERVKGGRAAVHQISYCRRNKRFGRVAGQIGRVRRGRPRRAVPGQHLAAGRAAERHIGQVAQAGHRVNMVVAGRCRACASRRRAKVAWSR